MSQTLAQKQKPNTAMLAALTLSAGHKNMLSMADRLTAPRRNPRGFSKYKPHQGAQEKARRVRQMASGFIRP